MVDERLRKAFPGITDDVRVTSPETPEYNCFAWAVGRTDEWWEPGRTWPIDTTSAWNLDALCQAFATQGFTECPDPGHEVGYEKIAIYCDEHGEPTHAARLVPGGLWTSKLGNWEDIEHTLADLAGADPAYGEVVRYMKRLITPGATPQG